MIEHLRAVLLRGDDEHAVALPTLLRLVRERDGTLDAFTTELEDRARASGPDAVGALLLLGHIQRQNGRLDEAITRYHRATELAPSSPTPQLALADTLRQMGRSTEALTAYERVLELGLRADRRGDVLRALIELSLTTGDVARARTWHQRLVATSPTNASVRRELADALLARRLYPEAASELQALARSLAGDNRVLPPVLRDLGRAQMQMNQFDEALASFRRALALAGAGTGIRRELLDDLTELYSRRNELDSWIRELERTGTQSWERQMLLGRLHAEMGHTEQAIAAWRRAAALRPGDVEALTQLVHILSQNARLDELLAVRRRLVAAAPRNPNYVVELADDLVRAGRRAEALAVLARASTRAGADVDMHERLAQTYARLGEHTAALRESELVARYDPSDPAALEALGERWLEAGQRERALATWARIREHARDRVRGTAALAEVYARHDMGAQAMALYREAIEARPDELDYHKGLAVVAESLRMFDPAIAAWRRVIELAHDNRELRREARARIVNLWHLTGRLGERIPALERAFGATPPDLEAGRDLAEAYARMRRFDDAERVLVRLVEADPGDVTTLSVLERMRTQRGDLAGAIEVLRRLVEADPRHAREWYQRMATHALALHRDAEALESAARAVELNPDDAQGHLRLGELYRARNDTEQAVAALRRALALNDRLFPTYFQLADLYLARDAPREAVELFRRVIRLAPDDELVARAGRLALQIAPVAGGLTELERDLSSASTAAPGRVVFRRLLVDLYAATCRPLIHALRHGDEPARSHARSELTRTGTRALKPLLDTLSDNDELRRRVALDLLGYLGNPNAAAALLTVAEGTAAHELRVDALRAAAAVADGRVLPRLLALARGDDPTLAVLATWGLARIRTPAATAALTALVARRAHPEVAAMAALGLLGTRSPTARATLRAALESRNDLWLPTAAMLALAPTADAALVTRFRASLLDGEWSRLAALAALGLVPAALRQQVVDDLAAGLFSPMVVRQVGGDIPLQRVAAAGLSRFARADTDGWHVFDDQEAASSIAIMLGRVIAAPGPPGGGEAALLRFREQITEAARTALTSPATLEPVLDALATPGRFGPLTGDAPSVSAAADEASRSIVRALIPSLMPLATHGDAGVRRRALAILASSDAPEAREALAHAVAHDDPSIAEDALTALASHCTEDVPPAVVRHLDAEAPWEVRLHAVQVLARGGGTEGTHALALTLAHDRLSLVRAAAARSLAGRTSDPTARAALERAARDDVDVVVREAARAALEEPGRPSTQAPP
jgi:tetratricopeptide (TPR) repeat protein